jgi:tRNA modification GTPase
METIVAIATAAGQAAISIIRLSGDEAYAVALKMFRTTQLETVNALKPRYMTYGVVVDEENSQLDEVLMVYFKGPNSYTREDMIEIQTHGSYIAVERIVSRILELGVRPAEKGEFTLRGYLNGRLDLTQAEAIMDLIGSKTSQGFDMALDQLKGKVSERVNVVRGELKGLMAHMEVCIDYPEEDIEEVTYGQIKEGITKALTTIKSIQTESLSGMILKEGIRVVIIGKPNVGKSSLLNALLKENRAIVTDIPGTTRDSIEEMMHIKGLPLRLIDTAGIRETEDYIEKIGVERSKALFNDADVVLLVLNVNESLTDEDLALFETINCKPVVVILNKIDLESKLDEMIIKSYFGDKNTVKTSILQDEGLKTLESVLYQQVLGENLSSQKGIMTNARQLSALTLAQKALESAYMQTLDGIPYEYILVDLEDAQRFFAEITGEVIDEEMLNAIFSSFCLGK